MSPADSGRLKLSVVISMAAKGIPGLRSLLRSSRYCIERIMRGLAVGL